MYSVLVLSLGAFTLLSHHLLYAGIDKASGPMKLQSEPKQEKGRKEKKEKRDKSQKHHRDLEKVEPVHKKTKYDNGGELRGKKTSLKEAGKFVMEQLENSDLSEEHGLPSSIPEPCESWESTQSSKSRKLERGTASAPTRTHGSIILRIKLPLQKHKSPDPVVSSKVIKLPLQKHQSPDPVISSKVPVLERKDLQPVSVLEEQNVPECAPANEEPCFSGRVREEASSREKDSKSAHGHSGSRKSKRGRRSDEMERQIRNLISNWKPAKLQGPESVDDYDQGWLSEKQQYKDPCARGCCGLESTVEDISSEKGAVASYQPRVCFMPEFNSYQMPYVFPF